MANEAEARASRGPCKDRLAGKVALVTGAGGGQGRAVSLLFAEAGARVLASDINAATLEETASLARERGLRVDTATVDATSEAQTAAWVADAIGQEGRIDILYNNGATLHLAPFADMTVDQWQETIRVELDVIFMPTKAVWPHMVAQNGGSIINIASGAGMLGAMGTGQAAHSAGKGGVIAVTRQLSVEGAPHWIRVNSISPGPVMTPAVRKQYDSSEGFRRLFDGAVSLARHGLPIDIAYAGLFLASDESLFVTGINLPVDGGTTSKVGSSFER